MAVQPSAGNALQERIERSPMNGYQWMIVGLCLLLNAQDGYDVSAVAYASSGIAAEFGLTGTQLGVVISTGLIGIVVGSFLLSPLADRIGRKPTVLVELALTAVGMAGGALAQSVTQLTFWRLVTGIGVGGVTACINVIASEYSNPRMRGLGIGLYTAGFGVGATLGGVGAAALLNGVGWRGIFVVGAINSIVVMVVIAALLPESAAHLISARPRNALARLNRIAARLGQPALVELPVRAAERRAGLGRQVAEIFGPVLRARSLLLWAGFFTAMFAFYLLTGWTPRLVVLAGGTPSHSAVVGLVLSIGGAIGAVAFGAIAVRTGVERLVVGYALGGVLAFVGLGATVGLLPAGLVVAFLAGLLCNGAIVGLFTLAPGLYPAEIRATGVGWANGVGRTGSILAPLTVGVLVDAGWTVFAVYAFAAVFLLGLAIVAAAYRRVDRLAGRTPAPQLRSIES